MMNRFLFPGILLLIFCAALVPVAIAAPTTTVTTTATVPPILKACSQAKAPIAWLSCTFPANQSAVLPDGPPYSVSCTDLSYSEPGQNIGTWEWDFGDGETSTLQNPLHSYDRFGTFTIRLTVTTLCGRQYSNTSSGTVSVYCNLPEPDFVTNVTGGSVPLVVQVTDSSRHTPREGTSWTYWLDNTAVSNERDPVFTFSSPGAYTISQTVSKDCVRPGSAPLPPFSRPIIAGLPPTSPLVNVTGTLPATTTRPATPAPSLEPPVTTAAPPVTTAQPQQTSETPATGSLSVMTDPVGVQVWVDDILRGNTPIIVGLQEGSHTLRLVKEGYNSTSARITVSGGKTTDYSATLVSQSGGGIAIVPVIALVVIILIVIGAGILLYRRQRQDKDQDPGF